MDFGDFCLSELVLLYLSKYGDSLCAVRCRYLGERHYRSILTFGFLRVSVLDCWVRKNKHGRVLYVVCGRSCLAYVHTPAPLTR